jgi:hypothetical protein
MPKAGVHLKQATNNEDAARKAAQSGYPDWAITMFFYAALHYIQAYAIFQGDNIYELYPDEPNQHERILSYVYDTSWDIKSDLTVFKAYETLFEASKTSRYLNGISSTSRKHFSKNIDEYSQELAVVRDFIKPLLSKA